VRRDQLVALLKDWSQSQRNNALEERVLAENFYLDRSNEQWQEEANKIIAGIGTVVKVGEMTAENQLRGKFIVSGDKGTVEIFFTLTPEHTPRIQQLDLALVKEK